MKSHHIRAIIARMDLELCNIAQVVAQSGSFAAAARQLDVAPSSVSRHVAALEADLGLRLFQRSTRVLTLTDEGRIFLTRTAPLLEAFEQAREEAMALRKVPQGTVRITASVAFGHECLMPLLPVLNRKLPGISLDCLLTDTSVDLLAHTVDLAIRLAPAPKGDLISTRLMTTRYHVCAPPGYITSAKIAHPRDLADHNCLLYGLPGFGNTWRFKASDGVETEYTVGGTTRISNALAMRQATRKGCGPALLADWLVRNDLADGRLVDLFPDYAVTATSFDTAAWVLYPSRQFLPAKTRAVIDFLKENLPL